MLVSKLLKPAAIVALGVVLLGYVLFGGDFLSYLKTSGRAVQRAAHDSVSVEFELQRARDMIDDILPQLQANVRLIAEDEVAIAALEDDIAESEESLDSRKRQLAALRDQTATQQVSYRVGRRDLSRDALIERLSQEFVRYREAELILESKKELLRTRRQSLQNALQMHDRVKHQKLKLEQKVEALVAQHRLLQSSQIGSRVVVDGGQLTRADELLAEIERRLDVSERVLAHESDLHEIQLDDVPLDEADLLAEYDAYFDDGSAESLVVKK